MQKIFGCMSCNCNGSDLRKKYSGMFFSSVRSNKPEREYEKKLREKEKEKQKDEKVLD